MSSMLDVLLEQSNETIDAMLEDGVDPSEYYLIEHHLASQDFTKLEKAAVEMVKEGYHVDDADEFEDEQGERWFAFAASTESTLDRDVLSRQIREILVVAEECEVEYDGWGTFLDEDEEDFEDE
ncbi:MULTISPECIES: ribonuclease E inhibitor RraB [Idiomarina]|uniref:Ribonuclease E inhibitor RraB n=2 Tax=Idiomarina baltica TaxID=190892 RepID=A0A348WMJ5_9GAMM|nr:MULTISPECIES: ribonuclease E inhibitor RraB [Idiomarina]MAD53418.1 RNase E inhibitor RraB [Idiomarinaceae bacterium]MEC8925960.1 ribonuclease E inhibitor RraB [Pseudomonadota bacterium]EAQ31012.1 hypothetical protein OS145_05880 [Idiomarina baltica OS145]KXS35009.1 MAG: hypothetical protein AWU56_1424 [Idiomarina sp. T82-3]MAF76294.1 RNase E inhibitor RraB [Idiomarinaceae bacterium]|tara:strand:- start:1570 stop:1941 length:372 start_codon:yes stop_codon:yes gene_type:complete